VAAEVAVAVAAVAVAAVARAPERVPVRVRVRVRVPVPVRVLVLVLERVPVPVLVLVLERAAERSAQDPADLLCGYCSRSSVSTLRPRLRGSSARSRSAGLLGRDIRYSFVGATLIVAYRIEKGWSSARQPFPSLSIAE
jgi:hypothetical protein